jgi:hypothetical protein
VKAVISVHKQNLEHALDNGCEDPDCEIHHPEVIEEEPERDTAKAWFYAGAMAYMELLDERFSKSGKYNSTTISEAIIDLRGKHGIHRI